ncbi:MAG TPA: hypothetical protein PLL53_19770, partial [Saprospiraceae bacterium]|nr:hypothetical protein [Saprospiraceae bacterium]
YSFNGTSSGSGTGLSISMLGAGTYNITLTDGAMCIAPTTVVIPAGPAPTTPTFTQVPAICSGGSFTLPATSNNGIN